MTLDKNHLGSAFEEIRAQLELRDPESYPGMKNPPKDISASGRLQFVQGGPASEAVLRLASLLDSLSEEFDRRGAELILGDSEGFNRLVKLQRMMSIVQSMLELQGCTDYPNLTMVLGLRGTIKVDSNRFVVGVHANTEVKATSYN